MEHYEFIRDDRLLEAPTIKSITNPAEPVLKHIDCMEVLEYFLKNKSTYAIPVINDDCIPEALVDRRAFIEFFARLYTREIYGRRSVSDLLHDNHYQGHKPLIIEESCGIEDAAQIIVSSGMHHMVTGFIVTRNGRYQGVANGHDLLNIITQRKQAEMFYLAHYDNLTGVPNRTLFADRLNQAILDAQRRGNLVALLFIDVDRFKAVNDSLGHGCGDVFLRSLANRLRIAARKSDTLARIGGDEFVILMDNMNETDSANLVAQRILDSMQTPIDVLGHSLIVTVSIGIAIYPRDGEDMSPLLAKADAAMYEAKAAGRNSFRIYRDDKSIFDPSRLSIEHDLRKAINNGELMLHYQPQVELATRQIRGVEALVRWLHPIRGMISPMEFIPVAEQCGLITRLGEWVLREACRQLREWDASGIVPIRMCINVSAIQLHQEGFLPALRSALEDSGVNPSHIELELTESSLMHNLDTALKTLNDIKSLGVSLAIDDFGTGFSSLNYLRRFPINRLKIDQSFVRDIENTPANESITKAIVALAESLSLDIVAEGIEKISEKTLLENLGCPEGQGYLFSKPLSAEGMCDWMEQNNSTVLNETLKEHSAFVESTSEECGSNGVP
jgi:diguanylate cyclase (GGDEF)-like protein